MRGRLNNILNNSVNFINNQVANGMLLLHSPDGASMSRNPLMALVYRHQPLPITTRRSTMAI